MDVDLKIINPLNYPSWNELLFSNGNCSFFHSSNWARVLHEAYGYKPLYFAEIRDGKLLSLISCMEVNSVITGRRGVSLPFTDFCEPIIGERKSFQKLFDNMIEYGKKSAWKSIEIRAGSNLPSGFPPSSSFYGHTLNLSKGEEQIYSNLRDSTRRNIKKAAKEGVEITINNSSDSLKEFYSLNCMTRRDHGLPPQPYSFFRKIHEYVLSKDLGCVVLASYNKRCISGAVFFHFGREAIYKYGASDRTCQNMRGNNLVMWEAIKRYVKNGYGSFCFGRTELENQGLRQFKTGWGTTERIINYYKYDLFKGAFVKDSLKVRGLHNKIFKTMPIPLLRIAGSLLYRHMG